MIEVDVLVVGAGPAGAATSVFLGRHGIKALMISRQRGTSDTPRAHITNQRTMETLRDAGLEAACIAQASTGSHIENSFWLRSMAGEELARTWSWGNDPRRLSDYATASPCSMTDLPQTKLEPILVTEAAKLGVDVRFGWELRSFTQDGDGVTAHIVDCLSGAETTIRAKFMVGADGARSRVVEQLGLPLVGQHGLGMVFNVLCEVDLSRHVAHRHGSLYSVIQPGSAYWAPVAVFRMVRPWNEWLVGLIVPYAAGRPEPTLAQFEQRIRESIGDDSLPITIMSTSKWMINDVYAERYEEGRVFGIGDAVHRHPPTNGLGSNTCVQDAFNLAWKLALVVQHKAGPRLLESYGTERQPVGRQIVARANKSFIQNNVVWDMLGGGTRVEYDPDEHAAVFDTAAGRAAFRREIRQMEYEYHAHGVEMNRRYVSSAVVPDPATGPPVDEDLDELRYRPTTRPGASLPHAWLNHRLSAPRVSTLDVAGKGRFVLFTGHGGEAWRAAARVASEQLGIDIEVVAIGPYLDYEDPYGSWADQCGITEPGCILVRPDLIVGWRSIGLPQSPEATLLDVLRRMLDRATTF